MLEIIPHHIRLRNTDRLTLGERQVLQSSKLSTASDFQSSTLHFLDLLGTFLRKHRILQFDFLRLEPNRSNLLRRNLTIDNLKVLKEFPAKDLL